MPKAIPIRSKFHLFIAEFTLLQKKLRSKALTEGLTLYTTLEPCTTGSRGEDKKPCAQWIIEKGISRVFIGILDPNPAICGKGYWQLFDANIEVDFFPSELVRQVAEINQTFIENQKPRNAFPPALAGEILKKRIVPLRPTQHRVGRTPCHYKIIITCGKVGLWIKWK